MFSVVPSLIYDTARYAAEVHPDRGVEDEFLQAVEARLGKNRFPLAAVTREDVQVGSSGIFFVKRRSQQAVVAKYQNSKLLLTGVFLATLSGCYATFGLYFEGPAQIARDRMKSFDELVAFDAFNQVCELILDQVVQHDLTLPDAEKAPRFRS